MDNGFELLDPVNARAFLKRFGPQERRRGDSCFHRGCVVDLTPRKAGTDYTAQIQDEVQTDVELFYDPIEGWSGDCTCDKEVACHHQYAAMRALLAENSTAVVRNLSSTTPKGTRQDD